MNYGRSASFEHSSKMGRLKPKTSFKKKLARKTQLLGYRIQGLWKKNLSPVQEARLAQGKRAEPDQDLMRMALHINYMIYTLRENLDTHLYAKQNLEWSLRELQHELFRRANYP